MKHDTEAPEVTPASRHRRGVRLFIALHLIAVGAIYAIALVVGGGFAGPPMPPITTAMASPVHAPTVPPAPFETMPTERPVAPATLPEWTRRTEIAAPWESR